MMEVFHLRRNEERPLAFAAVALPPPSDVEFNFEHGVNGEEHGKTAAFVTPGIVYMDRWVEVGVAGRFPLNHTTHEELDWGIIGIVDLFIDDLLPWTRWQPIGGMRPPTGPPGAS